MVSGGRERPGGMILCCAVETHHRICASKSSISAPHTDFTSPNFASIEITLDWRCAVDVDTCVGLNAAHVSGSPESGVRETTRKPTISRSICIPSPLPFSQKEAREA